MNKHTVTMYQISLKSHIHLRASFQIYATHILRFDLIWPRV